jgi:hypothetical protein
MASQNGQNANSVISATLAEMPDPPERRWRPGALRISQTLLDKIAAPEGAREPNATGFTDMQALLRAQGWR